MELFVAIEPKTVMYLLLNVFLWAGLGFLLYKLIRWKKS